MSKSNKENTDALKKNAVYVVDLSDTDTNGDGNSKNFCRFWT